MEQTPFQSEFAQAIEVYGHEAVHRSAEAELDAWVQMLADAEGATVTQAEARPGMVALPRVILADGSQMAACLVPTCRTADEVRTWLAGHITNLRGRIARRQAVLR